jgi:hypothetical protein
MQIISTLELRWRCGSTLPKRTGAKVAEKAGGGDSPIFSGLSKPFCKGAGPWHANHRLTDIFTRSKNENDLSAMESQALASALRHWPQTSRRAHMFSLPPSPCPRLALQGTPWGALLPHLAQPGQAA